MLRAEAAGLGLPSSTTPGFHLTYTGQAGVDGLLSGYAWASGTVTFAFPDSASAYEAFYGASEPSRGFAPIGAEMRDAIRWILLGEAAGAIGGPRGPGASVLGITLLDMAESGSAAGADLRVARSTAPSTAWAYYPNWREGSDVWFGGRYAFDTPRLGTYQFATAVHELGHALGLKHAHEFSNGFAPVPTGLDGLEFTVMSYRSKIGGTTSTGYTNGTCDYPQGWMMLDIAALQAMYGADFVYRAGNTRYAWDPTTGETFIDGIGQGRPGDGAGGASNRVFLTIWDGGGIDTFDLSNYAAGVRVDLSPGGFSVLSAAQLATLDFRDGTKARGNVFNALLYQGDTRSLIENAIGGAGADTLIGNQAANRLEGAAGNDSLDGGAGPDILLGGAGADTLRGGAGFDTFLLEDDLDTVIEDSGTGIDQVIAATARPIVLPAGVEILRLGELGRIGIGNAAANRLIGSPYADLLDGQDGRDVIEGGRGNDTLIGGLGGDSFLLRPGDDYDRIEDFAPGQDRLVLPGFGFTTSQVLARATDVAAGVAIDFGGGDGVLLAGLLKAQLSAADIVV